MNDTLDKLLTFVAEDVANTDGRLVGDELESIVRSTLKGLGYYVTSSGEIGNPVPKPVINYPYDQNVHYRGQRRRRGFRR